MRNLVFTTLLALVIFCGTVHAQENLEAQLTAIETEANSLLRNGTLMTRKEAKQYADLAAKTSELVFNKLPSSGLSQKARLAYAQRAAEAIGKMIVNSTEEYVDEVRPPDGRTWSYDKMQFFGNWFRYGIDLVVSNFRNLFVEGNPIPGIGIFYERLGSDARRTRAINKLLRHLDSKKSVANGQSLKDLPPERLVFLQTLYENLANIEPIQNRNMNRIANIALWTGIGVLAFIPVEIPLQLTDDSAILSSAIWLGLGAIIQQARTLGRGDNIDDYVLSRTKYLNNLGLENICKELLSK